ncbi:SDR family NAD(P)-dependent oxidoreductase [Pseudoxanthomonas indica]|uniref:NAD(P)-dependent dehydrogenase, short-chain alcohol dehydrogenase family n=1 Tax=Pseudoxanthomonas indica TaxID=428993 RepID=A0A1T5LTB0_9GAMM|nr:SDR family NAD(P)-dependent oxidoreductase [Pseudoxanthomonas indica]GGD39316.1 3-ketoacyl-ACP reductase [Pseudoxanthomonas indica]SKC79212.1 NAD(P)-dependent dehydrogenase, short-chain alcohol dehydrogenase family [Pseudoxanthomonas indica]
MDFSSPRVVVTGGFGALGRKVVEQLRANGARVAVLDHAPAPADVAAPAFGGVDLADEGAARQAIEQAAQALGGLDALVNIAGGFSWETIADGSLDTWDRLYRLNLRTALAASQAALPHLLAAGGGRIVNIGAAAAGKAATGMGAYAASKAGVARLTEALADEFKDRGITVNALLPSIIDTPANRKDMPDADASRWVTPAQLAGVVQFLLSEPAAAITGALIPVTGRV